MWQPTKLKDGGTAPYGFGWGVTQTKSGARLLEHGGAWQGFAAYIGRYVDDRLTVVVFFATARGRLLVTSHNKSPVSMCRRLSLRNIRLCSSMQKFSSHMPAITEWAIVLRFA